MKPIETKATKSAKLFKMLDITEQQFKQAKSWYKDAKSKSSPTKHSNYI